jgi:hypothetical protein
VRTAYTSTWNIRGIYQAYTENRGSRCCIYTVLHTWYRHVCTPLTFMPGRVTVVRIPDASAVTVTVTQAQAAPGCPARVNAASAKARLT